MEPSDNERLSLQLDQVYEAYLRIVPDGNEESFVAWASSDPPEDALSLQMDQLYEAYLQVEPDGEDEFFDWVTTELDTE